MFILFLCVVLAILDQSGLKLRDQGVSASEAGTNGVPHYHLVLLYPYPTICFLLLVLCKSHLFTCTVCNYSGPLI